MHAEYTDTPVRDFVGVTIKDLHKIEANFEVNVVVYKLVKIANGKTTAELVRWSTDEYPDTMFVNIFETHFLNIKDINMYSRSLRCRKCGESLLKRSRDLHRHESVCDTDVNREYKDGVYHPPSSIFERLEDEDIVVEDALRYYPYRATFDFECFFHRG